jgi:ribosomal protein L37AE/L43A
MTHSDGGKGSARRPGEGYQDNWERIFGDRKRQITEAVEADNEDTSNCPRCNTEMSITGTHLHWHCDVCGWMEKIERGEP